MKLNNRGWGLRLMILFVLILMFALVVVATLVNTKFSNLVGNKFDYSSLENKVVVAAQKEQTSSNRYIEEGRQNIITVKKLQELEYLSDLSDNTNTCSGYAIISKKSGKLVYNAYIKCGSNYKTTDYNKNLDN